MGKNKGNKGKVNNNVFKVAGARSLKIKNKAKQVAGQLKKLNQVTRQKTEEINSQLASLHSTLMQKPQKPTPVDKGSAVIAELKKMNAENTKKVEEHKKRVDDINKLSDINMESSS